MTGIPSTKASPKKQIPDKPNHNDCTLEMSTYFHVDPKLSCSSKTLTEIVESFATTINDHNLTNESLSKSLNQIIDLNFSSDHSIELQAKIFNAIILNLHKLNTEQQDIAINNLTKIKFTDNALGYFVQAFKDDIVKLSSDLGILFEKTRIEKKDLPQIQINHAKVILTLLAKTANHELLNIEIIERFIYSEIDSIKDLILNSINAAKIHIISLLLTDISVNVTIIINILKSNPGFFAKDGIETIKEHIGDEIISTYEASYPNNNLTALAPQILETWSVLDSETQQQTLIDMCNKYIKIGHGMENSFFAVLIDKLIDSYPNQFIEVLRQYSLVYLLQFGLHMCGDQTLKQKATKKLQNKILSDDLSIKTENRRLIYRVKEMEVELPKTANFAQRSSLQQIISSIFTRSSSTKRNSS